VAYGARISDSQNGVTWDFRDSTTAPADLLVGADGVRSVSA
jgi:2-polyprenyl-6-methoxyphenol hydroxylase-like FAD-dependent oxidoreductase